MSQNLNAAEAAKNCDAIEYPQELIDVLSDKVVRMARQFARDFELRLQVLADAYAKELVYETYEGDPYETMDEATDVVGEATALHLLKRDPELYEEFEDLVDGFLSDSEHDISGDDLSDDCSLDDGCCGEPSGDCECCRHCCGSPGCPHEGRLITRFESDGVDVRVIMVRDDLDD